MKKLLAVIMALCCVISVCGFSALAADDTTEAETYDYKTDPLVCPTYQPDYANGDFTHAVTPKLNDDGSVVTDEEGNVVTEQVLDEDGNPLEIIGAKTYAIYQITTKKMFYLNQVPTETVIQPVLDADGNPTYEIAYEVKVDEDGNQVLDEDGNVIYDTSKPILDENGEYTYDLDRPITKEIIYTLTDGGTTSGSVKYEGIQVVSYYAVKCPKCHQANGGTSYYAIYSANDGCCVHCGYRFPSPSDSSMKFYRFVAVEESSAYYSVYRYFDLAQYSDSTFGPTEYLYGDGEDLPQPYLQYEDVVDEDAYDEEGNPGAAVSTLMGFATSGKVSAGKNATLYNLLTNIEYWFEPISDFLEVSKLIQFRTNVLNLVFTVIDKILTAPFTGF